MLVEDVMVDGKDGSGAERVVAGLRVDIMIYRKCFMIRREPNLINRDRDHISTMTFLDQSKAISILYHQSHSQSVRSRLGTGTFLLFILLFSLFTRLESL